MAAYYETLSRIHIRATVEKAIQMDLMPPETMDAFNRRAPSPTAPLQETRNQQANFGRGG